MDLKIQIHLCQLMYTSPYFSVQIILTNEEKIVFDQLNQNIDKYWYLLAPYQGRVDALFL